MMEYDKKIIVRLLPPTLDQSEFFRQLKQYVKLNNLQRSYYVEGRASINPYEAPTYSRVYLFFKSRSSATEFVNDVKDKPFTDDNNDAIIPEISNSIYKRMIDKSRAKPKDDKDLTNKDLANDYYFKKFMQTLDTNEPFDINHEIKHQKIQEANDRKASKKNKQLKIKHQKTKDDRKHERKKTEKGTKESLPGDAKPEIMDKDPTKHRKKPDGRNPKRLTRGDKNDGTGGPTNGQDDKPPSNDKPKRTRRRRGGGGGAKGPDAASPSPDVLPSPPTTSSTGQDHKDKTKDKPKRPRSRKKPQDKDDKSTATKVSRSPSSNPPPSTILTPPPSASTPDNSHYLPKPVKMAVKPKLLSKSDVPINPQSSNE